MKKLFTLLGLIIFTLGLQAQSGVSTFKYELRVPSLRVGGATKVKLDSIVQNVDTIKFYNGGTELKSNGAGIWTGSGIRLDTTLARVTLGIDQVPNLSLAAMFNEPTFTSITRVVDGILPTVSGASYLGSTSYQWGNLYLRSGSTLNWDDGNVLLTAGGGKLDLQLGDLDLNYGDLLTYGNIGSNAFNVNYGYFDSLYVANPIIGNLYGLSEQTRGFYPVGGRLVLSGADSLTVITTGQTTVTLPTSGTLLTTAVLAGYAPLSAPAFTDDMTVEYIRPVTSGGANLGHPTYPFLNVFLHSTGGVIWDASTDIMLAPASGNLRLTNSAFLIDNNDIGLNTYPVRKGYFTDLDIVNRPTVGASAIATTQDINDSIDHYISEATIGVAAADSNAYGGYTTRTYVESLLGSGTGLSASRLPFIIDVTAGAPSASDSTIIHSEFEGKHIDVYRDGAKQYQNFTATNTVEGFRVNGSTITVNPVWQANEQVLVDIIEPILWSYLSLEGEESTLLTGLKGYWPLDESSGTTVVDATGTQNGTTNATPVTGRVGSARYLNDINDAISIAHNDAIIPSGAAFSVSMWFYLDSLPSTVAGLEGYYLFNQLHTASPYEPHNIQLKSVNNLLSFTSRNTSSTSYSVANAGVVSDSAWHHIVVINRGNGQTLQMYIDGADVSTSAGTFTGTLFEAGSSTYFGHAYNSATQFMRGRIDECGIWGRALTSGEVAVLWNSGSGTTYPFN
jgi:hypothetical protein